MLLFRECVHTAGHFRTVDNPLANKIYIKEKYSLQGTTQGRYLTGGARPSDFPCNVQTVACGGYGGNHQVHHPPLVVKGYILPCVEAAGNLTVSAK